MEKHETPLPNATGEIVQPKLIIYAGDREQYYTFVTAEA